MFSRNQLMAFAAAAACAIGSQAVAGPGDCECDCYFSFDCQSGQFCNYGNLSIEDSCWWRMPKPDGNVGAGCGDDYGDWGQCDGKCSGSLAATDAVKGETAENMANGILRWAEAMNAASLSGGGVPSAENAARVDALDFNNETMSYALWRMTLEVMILSRGVEYVQLPQQDQYNIFEVGMSPLAANSPIMHNGNMAVRALLAEVGDPGSGRFFIDKINASVLDDDLMGRVCEGASPLDCLYVRIADMANIISQGEGEVSVHTVAGGNVLCGGCDADCVPNDWVDINDLLEVLDEWGNTDYPLADVNESGNVDVIDLLGVLESWGKCVKCGPLSPCEP